MIEGVRVVELTRHIDDRGYLYEILHATDDFLPKFGQNYIVCSPVRGTIRGFHKHNALWDYFHVARGTAKFILADAPDEAVLAAERDGKAMEANALQIHVISDRKPALLVVPPDTWHGWMALEDDTMVVANGSEVYNRDNPDEVRVGSDVFGDVWPVKGR